MLRTQRAVPRIPPRLLGVLLRAMRSRRFVRWSFEHYLRIAPPPDPAPAPRAADRAPVAA
jgi:hypothetical protein